MEESSLLRSDAAAAAATPAAGASAFQALLWFIFLYLFFVGLFFNPRLECVSVTIYKRRQISDKMSDTRANFFAPFQT